jgi:hypothetical protein
LASRREDWRSLFEQLRADVADADASESEIAGSQTNR